jgi:hypothetical protein
MIKRAPFMFSQYTFYVLLVSLFLQSCFTKTKDAAGGHPDLIQQIVTCQLLAREFTTQEGHTVTFCKQRGEISATVKINRAAAKPLKKGPFLSFYREGIIFK